MEVRVHLHNPDGVDVFFEWPSLEGAEINIRHLLSRGYTPAVAPSTDHAARLTLLEQQVAAVHERLARLLEAWPLAAEAGSLARLLEHLEAVEHLLAAPPPPAPVVLEHMQRVEHLLAAPPPAAGG